MTSSDSKRRPSAVELVIARNRHQAEREIRAGRLPTLNELLEGAPFAHNRLDRDAEIWARSIMAEPDVPEEMKRGLDTMASAPTPATIAVVRRDVQALLAGDSGDIGVQLDEGLIRLDVYSVMCRSPDSRPALLAELMGPCHHGDINRRVTVALGIRAKRLYGPQAGDQLSMDQMLREGSAILGRITESMMRGYRASLAIAGLDAGGETYEAVIELLTDLPDPDPDDLDHVRDVIEDRAEFRARKPGALDRIGRDSHSLHVIPLGGENGTLARREIWKSFQGVAGAMLPLVRRGDVVAHRITLQLRAPHAVEAITTILRDLASSPTVWIRPTLLVGPPGAGKTSLARAIADVIGLPSTIYSAGGMSDSSMMGTSAQWSTARPSVPLDLIRMSKTANPLVILDEIDKASLDRRNGAMADALLGFLEPTTSRRYRDLALEVEVDLSRVSWIATANKLEDVPAPLRDRMRIVRVEEPTWEHVGDLARNVLDDIAAERGLDRRWLEELALDELEVLRSAWDGGSIRKLRRALEVIVDGRDSLMGRA